MPVEQRSIQDRSMAYDSQQVECLTGGHTVAVVEEEEASEASGSISVQVTVVGEVTDYGMMTVVWIVADFGMVQVMDYETGVGYQSRMTGVLRELGTEV